MLKKINVFTILIVGILAWFLITFYSIIEEHERPQYKATVSRVIREEFFKHRNTYQRVGDHVGEHRSRFYPDLNLVMDSLELQTVEMEEKSDDCGKSAVIFTYRADKFSPEYRVVQFKYYPEGICKEMMETIKRSDNKWNWAFYLDKNWVAQSVKKHIQY